MTNKTFLHTGPQRDALFMLYNVACNKEPKGRFSQRDWSSCLGHFAAENGIGGLYLSGGGFPRHRSVVSETAYAAIAHVMSIDATDKIFARKAFADTDFKEMVYELGVYLQSVYPNFLQHDAKFNRLHRADILAAEGKSRSKVSLIKVHAEKLIYQADKLDKLNAFLVQNGYKVDRFSVLGDNFEFSISIKD